MTGASQRETVPRDDLPAAGPKRPRLWPVLVVAIFGMPAAAIIAGVIMALTAAVADGGPIRFDRTYLQHVLTLPPVLIASVVGFEVGLGLVVIVPSLLSPEPWYRRLGLVGFRGYGKALPLFILGTFAINHFLSVVLPPLVGSPASYEVPLVQILKNSSLPGQIVLIFTATIFAGFIEEIVFRGYIQRRLLRRWPVWLAIGAASLLFALAHFSLSYAVYILPIGIWLGLVAWRTGSTWCSMTCHLFNNLIAVIVLYAGGASTADVSDAAKWEIPVAVVAVPIMIWAGVVLFRLPLAAAAPRRSGG